MDAVTCWRILLKSIDMHPQYCNKGCLIWLIGETFSGVPHHLFLNKLSDVRGEGWRVRARALEGERKGGERERKRERQMTARSAHVQARICAAVEEAPETHN